MRNNESTPKMGSLFENRKVGLVLSGGLVRASAWHLGVGLALEELGLDVANRGLPGHYPLSTIVGSSAGSMIGAMYLNQHDPREIINSSLGNPTSLKSISYRDIMSLKRVGIQNKKRKTQFDLFQTFPAPIRTILSPLTNISGVFSTLGLRDYLDKHVLKSNAFEDYETDFFVTATQLDHSRKVIFSKYHYPNPEHDQTASYYTGTGIADAAAASMSMPPFYCPYPIQNTFNSQTEYYIDGEIRDTLSTHVAVDNGCDFIISSWTHTPYHYQPQIGSLAKYGIPAIATQAIYLMIQKKIVSARAKRLAAKELIHEVEAYLRSERLDAKVIENVLELLRTKLNHQRDLIFVDICPDPSDFRTFFANPFSLEKKAMEKTVRNGFKKTISVFREMFNQ